MKLWLKKIPTYRRAVLTQEQVWKLPQTALEGKRMTQGKRERDQDGVSEQQRTGQRRYLNVVLCQLQ